MYRMFVRKFFVVFIYLFACIIRLQIQLINFTCTIYNRCSLSYHSFSLKNSLITKTEMNSGYLHTHARILCKLKGGSSREKQMVVGRVQLEIVSVEQHRTALDRFAWVH